MSLDGIIVNRYSKMCFPVGVEMKKETIHPAREYVSFYNEEALFADGFDEAIIGYDVDKGVAVYDYDKCARILMRDSKMSEEDAYDYVNFNLVSAHVGEFTPSFVSSYTL